MSFKFRLEVLSGFRLEIVSVFVNISGGVVVDPQLGVVDELVGVC